MLDKKVEGEIRKFFEDMEKNPQNKQKTFMEMVAYLKRYKKGGANNGVI